MEEENQRKILADYLAKLQNPDQQKQQALGLLNQPQGSAPYQQKWAEQGWNPESMGMAGMGAIEGVKNVGNVANATDAFLAKRAKSVAPQIEAPAGELVDKSRMFDYMKNENLEAAADASKKAKSDAKALTSSKRKYGDISDHGAMMLNNVEARIGDDGALLKGLQNAQESNKPYQLVKGKSSSIIVPNYNTTPTGKIGEGMPLHTADDPFLWADDKYKATMELLQKHADNGIIPEIHTASDLIAKDPYNKMIPKDAKINMYVTGLDSSIHGQVFPGHPSELRVMRAAEKLKDQGFTNVNLVPAELSKADIKKAAGKGLKFGVDDNYIDQALEQNKAIQNDIGFRQHLNKLSPKPQIEQEAAPIIPQGPGAS